MRGVKLMDLMWVAHIEYENYPDSEFKFSAIDVPDMLQAIAKVYNHVREHYPFEIISLTQVKVTANIEIADT